MKETSRCPNKESIHQIPAFTQSITFIASTLIFGLHRDTQTVLWFGFQEHQLFHFYSTWICLLFGLWFSFSSSIQKLRNVMLFSSLYVHTNGVNLQLTLNSRAALKIKNKVTTSFVTGSEVSFSVWPIGPLVSGRELKTVLFIYFYVWFFHTSIICLCLYLWGLCGLMYESHFFVCIYMR